MNVFVLVFERSGLVCVVGGREIEKSARNKVSLRDTKD